MKAPVLAAARPRLTMGEQIASTVDQAAAWIQGHGLDIALASAAAVAIYIVLNVIRLWALRACRTGAGTATWYSVVGRALGRTSHIFMIFAAARLVIGLASAPAPVRATVITLFTIASVLQVALWIREFIFGAVEHRALDQHHNGQALSSAMGIIRLLVSIAVFAVAAVMVLGNLGVNVTGLIAGLGVGGIAIGLAAQGIFADLFAALAILFDRPFQVGDSISYDKGGGSGTVEAIGLKSTRIRGGGGEERILSNKRLLDFEILNTTHRLHNRFKYEFHIGYATPPEVIRRIPELLKDAVEGLGFKLVHGGLNGFGDSGLSYDVEFESVDTDFPAEARDKVAAEILARFRDHDVSFAYPTQVNLVAEKTKPTPPATVHGVDRDKPTSAQNPT